MASGSDKQSSAYSLNNLSHYNKRINISPPISVAERTSVAEKLHLNKNRETIMASKIILVIHGPSLNMLGKREPGIYGTTSLNDINKDLLKLGKKLGLRVDTFQSNHEGAVIDKIHEAFQKHDGLIINPGAYTHTSIAIRDALTMIKAPVIEVHLSNIYKREPFRHKSFVAEVATASMCGFGHYGYYMALEAIARMLK